VEAEDGAIESNPLVHLGIFDVGDHVVDRQEARPASGPGVGLIAGQEEAVIAVTLEEGVEHIPVGADARRNHAPGGVPEDARDLRRDRAAAHGGLVRPLRIAHLEGHAVHAVAVAGDEGGRRGIGEDRRGDHQADLALGQQVARAVPHARFGPA